MFLIEILLIGYFIYFVSYSIFFSVGGLFYQSKKVSKLPSAYKKFAVLIPGYKEDHVILNSVEQNLQINYPRNNFDLIVIADSFEATTIEKLVQFPIIIQEVSFEKSTKVKSLILTINELPNGYDYVVILDADNVMEKDYLSKVNLYLQANPQMAVQTQRWPKNINTNLAILDGISESINNHIYRQGAEATGFSVSLSGSGMVFERNIFQKTISQMDSIGGFDRELEFRLLEQGIKVHYFKEAKVLDQKTDDHGNFQKQRTRWISSQYVYLFRYLGKGFLGLLKGNIVYFHSTVWRNIQLPRLINLGLLTIFTFLAIVLRSYLDVSYGIWIGLWVLNATAMMLAIPKDLYNKKLVLSILMLPKLFVSMFLILFKMKGANKKFIHTEHKVV